MPVVKTDRSVMRQRNRQEERGRWEHVGADGGIHWDRGYHGLEESLVGDQNHSSSFPGTALTHGPAGSPFGREGGTFPPNHWTTPKLPSPWPNTHSVFSAESHGWAIGRMVSYQQCLMIAWVPFSGAFKMHAVAFWYFPYVTKFTSLISQSNQKAQRQLVMYVGRLAPLRKGSIVSLKVISS